MVSSSPLNIPTLLFGIVPWPHLPILSTLDNKQQVSDFFRDMHGFVAYILAVLVAGHATAALKHHFITRDDILLRMAPRFSAGFLNRLRGRT
jgi:cytochrome b561